MDIKKIFLILIIIILFLAASAPRFSLENETGMDKVLLSEAEKKLLRANGFVVSPVRGNMDEIHDIYIQARERNQPLFITTDSMLHTAHIFFNYLLRILEMEKLYDLSRGLTAKMRTLSQLQYDKAEAGPVKEAARLNIGFFSVPEKIFDPSFQAGYGLEDLVEKESANISAHPGLRFRELLTYVKNPNPVKTPYAYEDYSQYAPRGHYTRNEKFEKYFQVMMWYGRMDFKLKPGETEAAIRHGRHMTLQALLAADALMRDPEALAMWEKLYKPTVYFVGKTDGLHPPDYIELIREFFPKGGSADKYGDSQKLETFIQKAAQLKQSRILSGAAAAGEGDRHDPTQGFRFMGQRFIPDSAMFQQLVFHTQDGKAVLEHTGSGEPFTMETVPGFGPVRAFPRGLDVMAVLGSDRALRILKEEGDTEYTQYHAQITKLRGEMSSLKTEEWTQNLYWSWLHSLRPLLEPPDKTEANRFMHSPAWLDKQLMTSLGSWAELRHDTILYAKQSYTLVTASMPLQPHLTFGYVEPYPEVYRRLQNMMEDLRETLNRVKLSVPEVSVKIHEFKNVLLRLADISEKELRKLDLTEKEYRFIWNMGSTLSGLKQFPKNLMDKITSGTDERMDVIADVHTDLNTSQVLEEGVGSPFNIFVTVGDGPDKRLCRGAVFSYYEFKWPLSDRLTDEAWQKMGAAGERPDLPRWTSSFIAR
ncbi:MAG: DUF3160 domain-containing protein [Candidatus Aminicenantaceae bacterium]